VVATVPEKPSEISENSLSFLFILLFPPLFTMGSTFQVLRDVLNQSFGATINTLRAELDTIKSPRESRPPRRPRLSLPDPDKFTGSALKFDTL
jgi:hypothetical protein